MTLVFEPEPTRVENPQLTGRIARQLRREAKMRQLIVGFKYNPEPGWEPDAECGGVDVTLFILVDAEAADMSSNDVNAENVKRNDAARKYCTQCPVVAQCLGTALTNEFTGTWGGELLTAADWHAGRKVRKELEGQ